MKPCQQRANLLRIRRGYSSIGDRPVEHEVSRQPAHLDQPINRFSGAGQTHLASRINRQRHDAIVNIRRQPAIQPQFLFAVPAPRF